MSTLTGPALTLAASSTAVVFAALTVIEVLTSATVANTVGTMTILALAATLANQHRGADR